jgi:hypothetical protein
MFSLINTYNDKNFNGDFVKIVKLSIIHLYYDYLFLEVHISTKSLVYKYEAKIQIPVTLDSEGKEIYIKRSLLTIYESYFAIHKCSQTEKKAKNKKEYALVSRPVFEGNRVLSKLYVWNLIKEINAMPSARFIYLKELAPIKQDLIINRNPDARYLRIRRRVDWECLHGNET